MSASPASRLSIAAAKRKLVDFLGRWGLAREIRDRRGRRLGRFSGQAWLDGHAHAAIWTERGTLVPEEGPPMTAERTYLWSAPEECAIDVAFADGRPFHAFDPTVPIATAVHVCGEDRYEATYEFADWPVWRLSWRVMGPRKDLLVITTLTPPLARAPTLRHTEPSSAEGEETP